MGGAERAKHYFGAEPTAEDPIRSIPGFSRGRLSSTSRSTGEASGTMGIISTAADAAVALFSFAIVVAAPLLDAQSVLPHSLFPAPLLDFKRWYAAEYGDYLLARPPGFFRGLILLELVFQWPLAVATLYGLLARRSWASTTCPMGGVVTLTSMCVLKNCGVGQIFVVIQIAFHRILRY